MRLNNGHKAGYFNFLSTLVILLVLSGITAFILEYFIYDYLEWGQWFFLIIPLFFAALFYYRGRQIFEYDSDGEALNFKNRNVIVFLDKSLSDEFPKYKLLSYEVISLFILKRLYVTINSKKSHNLTLRYDVSYLTKKELNDLKFSLSKVIKNNRKDKRIPTS